MNCFILQHNRRKALALTQQNINKYIIIIAVNLRPHDSSKTSFKLVINLLFKIYIKV